MVKLKVLLSALLVAAVACLAQPAGAAAPEKFDTKVTLKIDMTPRAHAARGTFSWEGRVKSAKDACENNRVVTLYTVPEGGGKPVDRGDSTTGKDGKYAVLVTANYDGEYYAEAAKRTLGNGNLCKLGRSESIFRDNMP
jgi:hypothetical protein